MDQGQIGTNRYSNTKTAWQCSEVTATFATEVRHKHILNMVSNETQDNLIRSLVDLVQGSARAFWVVKSSTAMFGGAEVAEKLRLV